MSAMDRARTRGFTARLAGALASAVALCLTCCAGSAFAATGAATLLAPTASSLHNSPLSVEYELPEAGSSGTISFIPSSGPSVAVTLSSPALAAGKHHFFVNLFALASESANISEASASSLADGEYTVSLSYSNLAKEPNALANAAKVTIKNLTAAPSLSEPKAKQSFKAPFKVAYTLPEAALPGTVLLTLVGAHTEAKTITLSNSAAGSHSAEIVPSNLVSGAGVASAPGGRLPADSYAISLSYQDTLGNPAAAAFVAEVGISYPLCKAGSYGPGGEEPCTKAPKGSYVDLEGAEAALPCAPGTFASEEGLGECTKAQPGHYVSESGAKAELECEQGSYTEETEALECSQATAGHYAPKGATHQFACLPGTHNPHASAPSAVYCETNLPGTFSGAGAAEAMPCTPGHYAPGPASVTCQNADPGSYVDESGASAEKPCPAGTFADVAASVLCTETPAGTYASGGAVAATPCPAGTTSGKGAAACTAESISTGGSGAGGGGGTGGSVGAAPVPQPSLVVTPLSVRVAVGRHSVSMGRKGRQRIVVTCSVAATLRVKASAVVWAGKKHVRLAGSGSVVCAAGKATEATLAFKLSAAAKKLLRKHGVRVKLAVRVYSGGAAGAVALAGASLPGRA